MSAYANYGTIKNASTYAEKRNPVSLEPLLGAIAVAAIKTGANGLKDCQVLDAGCGPGNYLKLVAPHVKQCDGIDISKEMLEVARNSVLSSPTKGENVNLFQIDLNSAEEWKGVENGCYDAIYCNQVLQHLKIDEEKEERFFGAQNALQQFYKLLKPGGALILNLCTAEQRRKGFWWAWMLMEAVEKIISRVPQPNDICEMLENAGFSEESVVNIHIHQERCETLQKQSDYENAFGPLSPEWRVADSTWALASERDLRAVEELIRGHDIKEWEEVVRDSIEKTRDYGQNTTYIVYKQ